jgi:hypothetical protein
VFRRKLDAVKNLEELGRLISDKNVLIDNAFLQKKLQSLLRAQGVLIELNKQYVSLLYWISALFIVTLGIWIASAYPDRLTMMASFLDKEMHDLSQTGTCVLGLGLLGSIASYIRRGQRIKDDTSIIDKFKELGMKESGS